MKKSVLQGCDTYPAAIEKNDSFSSLKVYFSRGNTLSDLNGPFTNTGVRVMSKVKYYFSLEILVSFVGGIINWVTGLVKHPGISRLHTTHSYFVQSLTDKRRAGCSDGSRIKQLRCSIQQFKLLLNESLDVHYETGLNILKPIFKIMDWKTWRDLKPLACGIHHLFKSLVCI